MRARLLELPGVLPHTATVLREVAHSAQSSVTAHVQVTAAPPPPPNSTSVHHGFLDTKHDTRPTAGPRTVLTDRSRPVTRWKARLGCCALVIPAGHEIESEVVFSPQSTTIRHVGTNLKIDIYFSRPNSLSISLTLLGSPNEHSLRTGHITAKDTNTLFHS